ncbi:MAG: hypothetical protein Q9183_002103 [Haloplaca sp. 2 TL-2023]
MSRNKSLKTIDLDDELDDYDGTEYDEDYDPADEVTAEERARLQEGVGRVRFVLGPSVHVDDKDIEDSLWHYYYDVDKTVNYILQQHAPPAAKKAKKKNSKESVVGKSAGSPSTQSCSMGLSARDFFADAPWLNVPQERRGEILVEPLYSRGRLLGGSPAQDGPKPSKLAALAAARKRKENNKQGAHADQEPKTSATPLETPRNTSGAEKASESHLHDRSPSSSDALPQVQTASVNQPRKYPKRRRGSSDVIPPDRKVRESQESSANTGSSVQETTAPPIPTAKPSMFATTMFASPRTSHPSLIDSFQSLNLSLPTVPDTNTKANPFAGPSPDDKVIKAQNSSKGATSKKATTTPKDTKGTKRLSDSIGEMKIDDGPTARSKNLDVLAEFEKSKTKNAANFVVIGL